MEATPDVYRTDIAHTREHIARIDAALTSDTAMWWRGFVTEHRTRRALLVQQLANLEHDLARAAAVYVACPECSSPLRKTRMGGGKRRQEAWICTRAEAECYTDERGHIKRVPDAVHPYVRVWTKDELELA